jgi:hypothetical protein
MAVTMIMTAILFFNSCSYFIETGTSIFSQMREKLFVPKVYLSLSDVGDTARGFTVTRRASLLSL